MWVKAPRLGTAEEENLTVGEVVPRLEVPDFDAAIFGGLVPDGFRQEVPEGVLAENAYHEGRCSVPKRARRPIDEFAEVIEENSLTSYSLGWPAPRLTDGQRQAVKKTARLRIRAAALAARRG
jgi:hypothetical protein